MASDAAVVAVVAGVVGVAIVLAIVVAYLHDHWLYGTDPIGYEYGTSLHSARGEREPPPGRKGSGSPPGRKGSGGSPDARRAGSPIRENGKDVGKQYLLNRGIATLNES